MGNFLVIAVNLNIITLVGIFAFAFILGYMVRGSFINQCRKRIFELEKEMLRDNARILELEKEKVELLRSKNEPLKKNQP